MPCDVRAGAHDVVDARRVEAAVGEHAHARRRAAGASSCGPAPAARAPAAGARRRRGSRRPVARRDDLYASAMTPRLPTIAEAARRFGGSYRLRHRRRLVAVVRRHRPHLRRGRGRARAAGRARGRRRRRSCCPPGPEYLLAYARGGQARRDHRGRERPPLGARARRDPRRAVPSSSSPPKTAPSADSSTPCSTSSASTGEAPPSSPTIPTGRSRSSSRRAPPACPKGALYCNRQLAFITQTDVGDAWDGGGRSFSGTSFAHLGFMTKLPGNLRRGGTTFIMERWRARDRARAPRPRDR